MGDIKCCFLFAKSNLISIFYYKYNYWKEKEYFSRRILWVLSMHCGIVLIAKTMIQRHMLLKEMKLKRARISKVYKNNLETRNQVMIKFSRLKNFEKFSFW